MVEFRPSNPDDALGLSRCVDAVARQRRYLAVVSGFPEDQTRTFIRNLLENGGVHVLALDEGVVVGWCDVMPQLHEGMRHVGRLGMGLLPAYRGQGWGKRLLHETLDRAFAKGLRRVELDVFASNVAAQRLYERTGFVIEGRKRRARILDGGEDDILVMGLLSEEWARLKCDDSAYRYVPMLCMVIERFKNRDPAPIYARLRERGRSMPEGLRYVDSWIEANFDRCFQPMECDDVLLLQQWILQWRDLMEFEIVPVSPSKAIRELFHAAEGSEANE